jgi:excinuclease UvrABC nuclease subunit
MLLRWLIETICDANAIKNIGKETHRKTLAKLYEWLEQRPVLEQIEHEIEHVPKKLRFMIVDAFD